MRSLLFLLAVVTIAALAIASCGGSDSTCDAPLTLTQGTWCITIQSSQTHTACGTTTPVPTSYNADFTQEGNSLTSVANNLTYAGTICGNNAVMTRNSGGTSTVISIAFSDESHAAGSVDWNVSGCTGTDTFIAVAGGCFAN